MFKVTKEDVDKVLEDNARVLFANGITINGSTRETLYERLESAFEIYLRDQAAELVMDQVYYLELGSRREKMTAPSCTSWIGGQ